MSTGVEAEVLQPKTPLDCLGAVAQLVSGTVVRVTSQVQKRHGRLVGDESSDKAARR